MDKGPNFPKLQISTLASTRFDANQHYLATSILKTPLFPSKTFSLNRLSAQIVTHQERIDDLLDQWEEAFERGQDLSAEQLCADDPELLEVVRSQIAALKSMNSKLDGVSVPANLKPNNSAPAESNWDFGKERHEQDPCGLKGAALETTVRTKVFTFYRKGGSGAIYRGEDVDLGRQQAVKTILPNHAVDDEIRSRFEIEARLTARLEHPGIIPVYGMGKTEDGLPFYTMRFVEDSCLDDTIVQFHKQTDRINLSAPVFRDLLQRFISVCQTIAYAHSRGIVHRDIKPHNILMGKYGETLVIDWGLAQQFKREGQFKVKSEQTLVINQTTEEKKLTHRSGTLAYMSPEQHSGMLPSPSDDIYSLGATLFKILSGKSPVEGFENFSEQQIRTAITQGKIAPIGRSDMEVPAALVAICQHAMHLESKHRYQTALELANDVSRFVAGEAVSVYREPWMVRTFRWFGKNLRIAQILIGAALTFLIVWMLASLFFANLAVERQSAREANLISSAENFSRLLSDELDVRIRILETEARSTTLASALQAIENKFLEAGTDSIDRQTLRQWAEPLQDWIITTGQAYDGTRQRQNVVFNSLCIFDRRGFQMARYGSDYPQEQGENMIQSSNQFNDLKTSGPGSKTVGERYNYRGYFRGSQFDAPIDSRAEDLQPHPLPFFISSVYQSKSSATFNFQITVPIYSPRESTSDQVGTEPKLIGLLGMALEIGKLGIPDNGMVISQKEVRLSATQSYTGLVLHHKRQPDYQELMSLDPTDFDRIVVLLEQQSSPPNPQARLLPFPLVDPVTQTTREALRVAYPLRIASRLQQTPDGITQPYETGWFLITEESETD